MIVLQSIPHFSLSNNTIIFILNILKNLICFVFLLLKITIISLKLFFGIVQYISNKLHGVICGSTFKIRDSYSKYKELKKI